MSFLKSKDSFPESYDIIVLDAFDNTDCPPDVFSSEVFFGRLKMLSREMES